MYHCTSRISEEYPPLKVGFIFASLEIIAQRRPKILDLREIYKENADKNAQTQLRVHAISARA
jgi:hypothetical protein